MVVEFLLIASLEEVDEEVFATRVASIELSTTPPAPGSLWSTTIRSGTLALIPSKTTQNLRGALRMKQRMLERGEQTQLWSRSLKMCL